MAFEGIDIIKPSYKTKGTFKMKSMFSGPFDVSLAQLSPKLIKATNQPSWDLNLSFTESIVRRANEKYRWYHFPWVTYKVYNERANLLEKNEAGFIEVHPTYDQLWATRLPLRVEWMYVGISIYWNDYSLAFYPRLISADGLSIQVEGYHQMYFEGFEKVLIDMLDLPYTIQPEGDDIIRVHKRDKLDEYMLLSEAKRSKDPLVKKAVEKLIR